MSRQKRGKNKTFFVDKCCIKRLEYTIKFKKGRRDSGLDDKFSIDEISKFSKISKYTLRYYDKIGLFEPKYRNPRTGYRYYEYSQLFMLNMIDQMKKLHIPLQQIHSLGQIRSLPLLEKTLEERQEIIEKEISELMKLKHLNEQMIGRIKRGKAIGPQTGYDLREFPERYIYAIPLHFPIEELYSSIKLLYSSFIRNIDDEPVYDRGAITLEIDQNHLRQNKFGLYSRIGFFVKHTDGLQTANLVKIEPGTFVIAYHIGPYSTIQKTYKKVMCYINEKGYDISGNSIETSIINISITDNPEEFITEIQIPVRWS